MQIKHKFFGTVIFECEGESLEMALEKGAALRGAALRGADLGGAALRGADLGGADLRGANLRGAVLEGADLEGADLEEANLRGADLRGADLRGADLEGADLEGAALNWDSHDMIAEVLLRAAGTDLGKRKVAGLVLISRDWCHDRFRSLVSDPLFGWAIGALAPFVRDGDVAPRYIRSYCQPGANTTADAPAESQ